MPEVPPRNLANIPRIRDGIDITRAGLTLEEGFLVSRVDGKTSIQEIAMLIGRPYEETDRLVRRLAHAGVVVFGQNEMSRDEEAPYEGFEFSVEDLLEPIDLSDEEKRRVLYTHAQLGRWSHYKLLGVRWRDDAKAIKRAYFQRSKEWHPDRFRRPRLGSYKGRIDEIFRAVKDAYGVLSDPKTKAEYDAENPPAFDEDDMAAILASSRVEERTQEREEERKRRRLERNPMRKRMLKAKSLHQEALEAEAQGELMEALQLAQAACALDDRAMHQDLKKRLQHETAEIRVAPLIRRGLHMESMTSWPEAIRTFAEAVRLAPEHGPARLRLAYNMLMGGRPPQEVNEHIQSALQKMPENPEAHFVRGLCYEKVHMDKAAIRAYQRAIELKPNYTEAKKRLKKLRWGF